MVRKFLANLIYGMIYISGLWLFFRYFNRRKTRILMYHGISEKDLSLWTQLPVARFEKQMHYIRGHYNVVGLADIIEAVRQKEPAQHNALAITFDDGFSNNKEYGYKVLKKYNLPATIFLTTAFINNKTRFQGLIWTDYISSLFRNTPRDYIDLRDMGLWELDLGSYAKRIEASRRVCKALKEMPSLRGHGIIDWLAARLGPEVPAKDCEFFKAMTWDEVRELDCDELISFGAHTVNHEILTKIPYDAMVSEIRDSKTEIEQQIGKSVRHFAYPNGGAEDFDPDIKEVVARHFDCALTTVEGLNSPNNDPYLLKRIGVGNDMDLWKFKLELAGVVEFACNIQERLDRMFAPTKKMEQVSPSVQKEL